VDGDGQMDTSRINELIAPILNGKAEYTKGNRFFHVDQLGEMPLHRLIGNAGLSFVSKLSSGFWNVFDPNNGFTAISAKTLNQLPLNKIDNGYFFESDMLFRLNLIGARVMDIPMPAQYGDEVSSLRIGRIVYEFPFKHLRNFWKRIMYTYYLRDFNLASIELPLGMLLCTVGSILGLRSWIVGISSGEPTTPGTLIFDALCAPMGFQ
jgi:hypothetical protein